MSLYEPSSVWRELIQILNNGDELSEEMLNISAKQLADNIKYVKDNTVNRNGDSLNCTFNFSETFSKGGIETSGAITAAENKPT